jgi:hypothetical protein
MVLWACGARLYLTIMYGMLRAHVSRLTWAVHMEVPCRQIAHSL